MKWALRNADAAGHSSTSITILKNLSNMFAVQLMDKMTKFLVPKLLMSKKWSKRKLSLNDLKPRPCSRCRQAAAAGPRLMQFA